MSKEASKSIIKLFEFLAGLEENVADHDLPRTLPMKNALKIRYEDVKRVIDEMLPL